MSRWNNIIESDRTSFTYQKTIVNTGVANQPIKAPSYSLAEGHCMEQSLN